ncbi:MULTISPECIES: DsrE family protein [Vagococcus]|uniref:DsrE family protein n=1 Tax=Vagococcus TaxID=2737 RepID=UPI002FCBC9B0
MKVILHINELEKWPTILSNATNLLNDGKNAITEIELLANGNAVKGYQEIKFGISMHELVEKGVKLSCCKHAMEKFEIVEKELPPFVHVVPSGVLRLVEVQQEGYAYIKV